MKRRFTILTAALALLAFLAVPMGMRGQNYSLTPDQTSTGSTATSYITTLTEFTYDGISWKMNQWNPKTLQIKTNQSGAASQFRYYNTSAFPGRITQVVMTFSALSVSDASKLMFKGGTEEVSGTTGGTAGTWNAQAKTLTWTPASTEDYTFFAFYQNGKAASGTNYLASTDAIVVTYETGGGGSSDPSLSVNPATLAFGEVAINSTNQQTFTVTYTNLTEDLTVDGFTGVTVNPTTIDVGEGSGSATVTVSYNPTVLGSISGSITVSNEDDEVSETVAVSGSAYNPSSVVYYERVTSGLNDWSGDYIFTGINNSNYYALSGVNNSNLGIATLVTVSSNGIQSSSTTDAYKVTVAQTTNGYSLHMENLGYLAYTSSATSSNNNLWALTEFEAEKCEWTFSFSDGVATITNVYNTVRMLQFNYNLGNPRFAGYTSNQVKITLFKLASTEPAINVAQSIEIEYTEQDDYEIPYSISNPVDGTNLTAASTDGWINNVTVGTGVVTFHADANTGNSDREGTITLTYGEYDTKVVTVTQGHYTAPVPEISANDVTLDYDATEGSITYSITNGNGGTLAASTSADWISSFVVGETTVTFTPTTNNGIAARTATVTLTYTYNTDQTVTKDVTVTQNADPALGTVTHPYTVAQARLFIDGLGSGQTSADGIHVSGIISQVDSYNSNYNSITYWISDDGTTTDQLQVYSGKGLNGAGFSAVTDVEVAAEVVVKGKLKLYNNSTYEFDKNNELVVYNAPDHNVATPTFSPAAGVYPETQIVTISCETEGATIYYTLDGTEPTSESDEFDQDLSINSTTTIKAIAIKGSDASTVATATYHIANSQSHPYSVPEALAFHEYPTPNIYVQGIVSMAPTQAPNNNGELTYYISIDGEANNQLEVYHGKGLNEAAFTAQDDIQVGDIVTIFGSVQVYNNNTIEFGAGNYLVEFDRPTAPSWSLMVEATNGTVTVSIGNVVQTGDEDTYDIPQGSEVVLTTTPATGYRFKQWNVEPDDTEVTVTIENNTFTMPSCDVMLEAVFELIPTQLYEYSINGSVTGNPETGNPYEVEEGTNITLNPGSDLSADFTFVGWTTDPNDLTTIHAANSEFPMDDSHTFYAVYSHTTTIGGNSAGAKDGTASYVKVTSTDDLEDGNYLIVYEDGALAFDGSLNLFDAASNVIDVTINDDEIAATTENNAAAFTIASVTGGYSIQGSNGKYIGVGSYSNGLTTNDDAVVNGIDFESNNVLITVETTGGTMTLKFNKASNQNRFRYYKSGQEPIQLYKYTDGGTPTPQPTMDYYTRVFLNETVSGNIDIVGPSIVPSGQTLDMGIYSLTNITTAANLVIEDGAQLIHSTMGLPATMKKTIVGYGDVNNKGGWYLLSSPLGTINAGDASVTNLMSGTADNYDIYGFDQGATDLREWRNYKLIPANNSKEIKYMGGVLYGNIETMTATFAGTLSNGGSAITLDYTDGFRFSGFNIVGNPFSSNAYLYGKANYYRLQENAQGESELVETSHTVAIAPMEAVFVQAQGEDEEVYFSKVQPESKHKMVKLQVMHNRGQLVDRACVAFGEGSILGKFQLNENNTKIYFTQGNKNYAVVRSANQGEMPVSFKTETRGTYTLNVEAENVEMNYLHLIDNMTGTDVDLLANPSYTFEANRGDNANRFRLVFDANNIDENASTSSATFAYYNGSEWVVSNMGEATLQVVDVMGRVLRSETINGNAELSINEVPGVYMLRLVNGNNVMVQKVIVK